MMLLILDPGELYVETFAAAGLVPLAGDKPTTQNTHERDCTYPDLCPATLTGG